MSYAGKAGIAALLGGVGQALDSFANMTAQEYQRRKQEEAAMLRQQEMYLWKKGIEEQAANESNERAYTLLSSWRDYQEESPDATVSEFGKEMNLSGSDMSLLNRVVKEANQFEASELSLKAAISQDADKEDTEMVEAFAATFGHLDREEFNEAVRSSDLSDVLQRQALDLYNRRSMSDISAKSSERSARVLEQVDLVKRADGYQDARERAEAAAKSDSWAQGYRIMADFAKTVLGEDYEPAALEDLTASALTGVGPARPGMPANVGRKWDTLFQGEYITKADLLRDGSLQELDGMLLKFGGDRNSPDYRSAMEFVDQAYAAAKAGAESKLETTKWDTFQQSHATALRHLYQAAKTGEAEHYRAFLDALTSVGNPAESAGNKRVQLSTR